MNIKTFLKMNIYEQQYNNLVKKIFVMGNDKTDRTGVGTLSIFGEQLKFNLYHEFPLLTTKKVFFRGVVEELLWFIQADTDASKLDAKGVKIWNEFGKRENLDKLKLPYRDGDLGPIYGFQWRHYGAKYNSCDDDYSGKGIDQLQEVIDQIKTNPDSRRLFVSAWNPQYLKKMALPPCHVSFQFYVHNGYLSCHMYQRSCDVLLGLPFNIASYALLTYMIAHICDLKPCELIISLGDVHIYKNQLENVDKLISRKPYAFPQLNIKRKVEKIDDFKFEDFELTNYEYHPHIAFELNV